MHDQQSGKHTINWGGLTKNILATTAIVAGAVIVAPEFAASLLSTIKDVGAGLAGSAKDIGEGLATGTGSSFPNSIAWMVKKAAGIALVVGGYKYLTAPKTTPEEKEYQQEVDESFAMREDLRRAEALMAARMQATGYQPAMALNSQQR